MHVLDAAAQIVEQYPGGAESLAPRIGTTPGVLRNKVNATNTTNHLTLVEANRMMGLTGRFDILQAMAQEHGFALAKVDAEHGSCPLVKLVLALETSEGHLARTILDALDDDKISEREADLISAAANELQAALISLVGRLRCSVPVAPTLKAVA